MIYKYITEDNLEDKQNYMYSEYGGKEFLQAYRESRLVYQSSAKFPSDSKEYHTGDILEYLRTSLISYISRADGASQFEDSSEKELVDCLVKSFEVRKRLYASYTPDWKPSSLDYRNYDNYIKFAELLITTWNLTHCTKYASCLMKLDDTLLSIGRFLDDRQKCQLSIVLKEELAIYDSIAG